MSEPDRRGSHRLTPARRRSIASAPSAIIVGMSTAAEISSLTSSLAELQRAPVTAMAEGALAGGDEETAHELIAVERSLGGALRRLRRFSQGTNR